MLKSGRAGDNLLTFEEYRSDGRKQGELRAARLEIGSNKHADGSALLQMGNTIVVAIVSGFQDTSTKPSVGTDYMSSLFHETNSIGRKSSNGNDMLELLTNGSMSRFSQHENALVNIVFRRLPFSGNDKRIRSFDGVMLDMENGLRQIFEGTIQTKLFPKSRIDIFVEVLQNDGSLFSVCVNTITLALMDAGIPMKDFVCSVTAILLPMNVLDDNEGNTNAQILIDPSSTEENMSNIAGRLHISMLSRTDKLIGVEIERKIHYDRLDETINCCMKAARDLSDFLREQFISDIRSKLSHF
ncbi:hypothetical protein SNEBB_006132 [Seison nebaliae]|nr:hypothetical protein SNEBB_006132 [Seison nebaliae]